MPAYSERIARLQEILRENRISAAVLAPTDQMRYLTGWAEHGHERLIALIVPANSDPAFLVPRMNAAQARENPAGIEHVIGWEDSTGWQREMAGLLDSSGGGILIDDELQSAHLLGIQQIKPRSAYTAAGELMARLREIKSDEELALMERSARVTDSVSEEVFPLLRTGMTEVELQDIIGATYKNHGTKPEFALICFGANTALPHHHTGDATLQAGQLIIIDIGCSIEGYASDITRTVAFGTPDPEAVRVYDIVHQAHITAQAEAKPGTTCEAVDSAARNVIEAAGYGEQFIHRTGHGIGLSTHEPPYIVQGNTQLLKPGMCFSDEPGIYLPSRFGVRIENILTVTESGSRSLNAPPPVSLPVIPAR